VASELKPTLSLLSLNPSLGRSISYQFGNIIENYICSGSWNRCSRQDENIMKKKTVNNRPLQYWTGMKQEVGGLLWI